MNKYKYPRGSEWRKWDLHAHTALDSEWISPPLLRTDAERRLFAEQYVEAAVGAELAVVAITDHNFCDNPEELLIPYLQEVAVPYNLTILPGFEVTVSDCGGTHVLVIFSEDSSLVTINEVMSQLFPPGSPRFRGRDILPSARRIEELNEILGRSKLGYLIVFAHADRENGVLNHRGSDLRAQLWKQPFVRIAQLSKSPSECTGFISTVVNGTNVHYSRNITYVIASDCRCLDPTKVSPERCVLGGRFTWIKADPTFEGLRQIIFEPNERTSFQEHKPEKKPDFLTIDQVRFLDSSGKFQSDPISLNPNLTAIIGGKSTGKSLLLSCIAQSIDSEQARAAVEIAKTNLYELGDLDFEVTWSTGDVNRLSENEIRHPVTFLPQMYIHRLVEQENRSSLSDSLLRFLRQNDWFDASYNALVSKRDEVMTRLATEISNFFSHLSSWRDIVAKIKELGDKTLIESELDKTAMKSEELRKASGFTEEETEEYKNLQESLNSSNTRHKSAQRIEASMNQILIDIPNAIEDALSTLDEIVADITTSHELEDAEKGLVTPHVIKLKQAIQDANREFIRENSRTAEELSGETVIATRILEAAKIALQPFWDKISNQQELKELQELARQLTLVLEEIRLREKEKSQVEREYWSSVKAMEGLIKERYEIQMGLIELFNDPTYTHIGDDTIISANLIFAKEKFEADFLGCFDLRYSLSRLGDFFQGNNVAWRQEKHVETITGILHKLIETPVLELKLRSGQELKDAVDVLLRDYLSHSFTVKQAGEDIFRMSPGKQGLILLEIFLNLSNSNYPILIDQPEDNLDNRTIYSHLVNYLRLRKPHRQIIMVTHNPNLVLGTDAEQVIVANQDGQGQSKNANYRFEYVSGAIECSFTDADAESVLGAQGIREHVCHVLEGGKEAFRKREEKYCLV